MAAEAAGVEGYDDWWWKERLGKCYYQIGHYREAEKQFKASLKMQDTTNAFLQLSNVYIKLDQPNNTIDTLKQALTVFPQEPSFYIALGRVYEMLNESEKCFDEYKQALRLENNNIEAVACIANHYFYEDCPEVSLRFYKRLLELGVNNSEIWNNMAFCLFTNSQFDLFMPCLIRAVNCGDDSTLSDIWYNIAQIALSMGEVDVVFRA